MNLPFLSTALVASLALLAGCASPPNSVNTLSGTTNREIVVDRALARALDVGEPMRGTASGNLLKVQVPVRNVSGSEQYFHYQFVWIDADGMEITSPQPTWLQGVLLAGEDTVLQGISPTPKAVDFKLKFTQSDYKRS